MCGKCHKTPCCCNNNLDVAAQVAELQQQMEELQDLARFMNGHPIIAIDAPSDINQFGTDGLGTGDWVGWAVCNGDNGTPDLRDRFPVGAGGNYNVGDTGGTDTVALTVAEMPQHSHVVNDPGHTHVLTDPGHGHAVTDPGHNHAASEADHVHTFTTDVSGSHTHNIYSILELVNDGGVGARAHDDNFDLDATLPAAGEHTHDGTTDPASGAITVDPAFTGLTVDSAFTGISMDPATTGISLDNTGSGDAHENRPPYHALLFIKKVA
jgi:microcystin-dependent protein